jgi:hypothetical protein
VADDLLILEYGVGWEATDLTSALGGRTRMMRKDEHLCSRQLGCVVVVVVVVESL